MAKKKCSKCQRVMEDTKFYSKKNGDKFDMCKQCLTMHVDNYNEDTYLWIIEQADLPWVPSEWNAIRQKQYAKKGRKMNGMSVVGKYFSKMRLNQWKKYNWATSEEAQEEANLNKQFKEEQQKQLEQKLKEDFEKGQITQSQYRTLVSSSFQKQHQYMMRPAGQEEDPVGKDNAFRQEYFLSEDDLPDPAAELTKEDKQYLAMKWGRNYKPSQWLLLETKYTEMMNSFDIQDADSKNTLMFICKTYLKMDEAIDIGDVESYQKLSRVYDQLRKSMKVTAAQKKEENNEFIDSVGQLVAFCQKHGHVIPEFQIKAPHDIVDKVINDMKGYNRSLIYEDKALARQIEDYIKEARAAAARKKDREEAKKRGQDYYTITDKDILDYKDFLHNEKVETEKEMSGEKNNKRRTGGLEEVNVLNNPTFLKEIIIPTMKKEDNNESQ